MVDVRLAKDAERGRNLTLTTDANLTTTELSYNTMNFVAATTTESLGEEDSASGHSTEVIVTTTIGLSFLIIVGVAGNIMTIFAYSENRKDNKVHEFFILNLAISDLIICGISIPFNTVHTLMGFTWPFGYWSCTVWMLIEFTATTEATLLILVLSLDILLMISLGTLYEQKVTWKMAKIVLVLSWILSFLHFGPALLWEHFTRYASMENVDYCDAEFVYEYEFVIIMTIMEFVIPFISLAIINGLLFYKIWKWANIRQQAKGSTITFTSNDKSSRSSTEELESSGTTKHLGQCGKLAMTVAGIGTIPDDSNRSTQKTSTGTVSVRNKGSSSNHQVSRSVTEEKESSDATKHIRRCRKLAMTGAGIRHIPDDSNRSTQQTNTRSVSVKSRRGSMGTKAKLKSAKFLAALVLAFLFCWLPYEISTFVISVCNNCVNDTLYEFFIWLLLIKSVVNPFLYAFNRPRYRRCFRRYITLNGSICKAKSVS